MPQDIVLARLLSNNAQWAEDVKKCDPDFFVRSASNPQTPKVLWIGCSDSRVPESVITASMPGDIFVHRNIANIVPLDDVNALSVLTYAVATVGVSHVIVAGHTHCGGAKACAKIAAGEAPLPPFPLGPWLTPLVEIAKTTPEGDITALVEANVRAQVANVVRTEVMKQHPHVRVHGWVYELETGRLRDLGVTVGKGGAA